MYIEYLISAENTRDIFYERWFDEFLRAHAPDEGDDRQAARAVNDRPYGLTRDFCVAVGSRAGHAPPLPHNDFLLPVNPYADNSSHASCMVSAENKNSPFSL